MCIRDSSKGEGLGNKFLSHIREVDAIVHLVRCFDSENIQHVNKNIDPINDLETIKTESVNFYENIAEQYVTAGRPNTTDAYKKGLKIDMMRGN